MSDTEKVSDILTKQTDAYSIILIKLYQNDRTFILYPFRTLIRFSSESYMIQGIAVPRHTAPLFRHPCWHDQRKHTHMDLLLTLVLTAAGAGCFWLFYLSIDFFENI